MKYARILLLGLIVGAFAPALIWGAMLDDLAAESISDRLAALDEFVKQGADAVPVLTKGLADKRAVVRMYSAKGLGRIGDASAVPGLLKAAKRKTNAAAIRAQAVFALGYIQTREVAGELLKICGITGDSADKDRYVRLSAAQALCRFRKKATMPAIIALLKHPDDGIPPVAARALTELTYRHFGTDYKKWKQWWMDNKASFKIAQSAYPYGPVEERE